MTTPLLVDENQFRALLRRHAAGVVVVTAPGPPPTGFTATSFASVSLRPPLVLFCIADEASAAPVVSLADIVAVHLLGADQAPIAQIFATRGIDRLTTYGSWSAGPSDVPLLAGVAAVAVCRVVRRIPAGDHTIVLCAVESGDHGAEEPAAPLVYYAGEYVSPPTWRST